MEALARDRGLKVRRSAPGQSAEVLARRIGGLEQIYMLADIDLIRLLEDMATRRGINWAKRRLRELTAEARGSADLERRIQVLEDALQHQAGVPSEEDRREVVFERFRSVIGGRAATEAWLRWAEDRGVVVRGARVRCGECGAQSWRVLPELAPPVVCRGCSNAIRDPYLPDKLEFRYAITEPLLRVFEHDSLGHLLTLRWLTSLFRSGVDKPEEIYGVHPGVIFEEALTGKEIGEVDGIMVFADGEIVIGECKRRAAGLTDADLRKLDLIAERLAAPWTFVATLDESRECHDIWRSAGRELPSSPRFALTSEHVFSAPMWTINENSLAWRDEIPPSRGRSFEELVLRRAETGDVNRPDEGLRRWWNRLDRDQPTARS